MEDIQPTYRWVAGPESPAEAARSYRSAALRSRRFWAVVGFSIAAFGLFAAVGVFEEPMSAGARLGWSLVAGVSYTAIVIPLALRIGGRANRRQFRKTLRPGDEFTSTFGPTGVELAGPLSRHELSYAGITSVKRVGDWVHLRQLGSPLTMLWPVALFPEAELSRMEQAVLRDRPSP